MNDDEMLASILRLLEDDADHCNVLTVGADEVYLDATAKLSPEQAAWLRERWAGR